MEGIVLWVLALFGLWNLISKIIESLYIENSGGEIEVVIKVKNQEKVIESLIKELSRITLIGKIKVIDMASSDSTVKLLVKMKKSIPIIEIIEEK